jgi:hypothetical protein
MKKLIYSIFLGLFLTMSACQSINNGVKVISKCCKAISLVKQEKSGEEDKEVRNTAILPVNSWDGKMMIW